MRRMVAAGIMVGLLSGVSHGAMSRGEGGSDRPPAKEMTPAYAEAEAAAREGRCKEALRLVGHVLSLDPTDAAAFNVRGYCLRKTGDLDGAFQAYGNALKLRPDFPEARAYLAEAHIEAAIHQAEVLRGYGEGGASALLEVAQALRRAAASVGTLMGKAGPKAGEAW